jgi:ketosteroid isomerase-like protein
MLKGAKLGLCASALAAACGVADGAPTDAKETVAQLDSQFQAAVKVNDASTMDRILHDNMVLVHGDGTIDTRAALLEEARSEAITYERQDEDPGTKTVRVWRDTAVITARLWVKGARRGGGAFDRHVWFSDTYIRTAKGWRYVFGQVGQVVPTA